MYICNCITYSHTHDIPSEKLLVLPAAESSAKIAKLNATTMNAIKLKLSQENKKIAQNKMR